MEYGRKVRGAVVCLALAGLAGCAMEDSATTAAASLVGGMDQPSDGSGAARFKVRIENVASFSNRKSGMFDTPVGAAGRRPLAPGQAYETKFTAGKAHALVFATMFGPSNDWFFATPPGGIALFDGRGAPVTGDITDRIKLYDAGTEIDEEPGVGAHTGSKQALSIDGPGASDPNDEIREVPRSLTFGQTTFAVPPVDEMLKATLSFSATTGEFTLRIQNVASDAGTLRTSEGAKPVRISPGVWALAAGTEPLFTLGAKDRGEGLEAIAESGDPSRLAAALAAGAGVATPVSPGVWHVEKCGTPFWSDGAKDRGEGLEELAERGDIRALAARCPTGGTDCGGFAIPVGASRPGAIRPGGAYEFELAATPGDRLSLALMYGASNDWFFGTPDDGIALFDDRRTPVTGDVTAQIRLWDAGTEADEEPAIGPHIDGPEGPADPIGVVRLVGDRYPAPVYQHLKVTISVTK